MALRSGVYVAFLLSVLITWFMKRYDKTKKTEKLKDTLSEINIENPLEALKNPNWPVRLKAVQVLSNLPPEEAIPSLILALDDEDSDVRENAADALAAYDEKSVPHLLKTLKGGRPNAREMALDVLAGIGGNEALEEIATALLNDESAWVRIPAAAILGETGDESYIKVLTQALQDSHADVYEAVVQALKQIGTKKAFHAINTHPYSDSKNSKTNQLE